MSTSTAALGLWVPGYKSGINFAITGKSLQS